MNVAIIGRPNTGKSSIFNCLIGKNKAVIDDLPGVTRDRLISEVEYENRVFSIIDTGGYSNEKGDDLILKHIIEQIHIAAQEADLVLFIVDGKTGLNPIDADIAKILRKTEKKVVVVVNKIDSDRRDFTEFYSLGIDPVIPVSAAHSKGITELLDTIITLGNPPPVESVSKGRGLRLSIAGRPNTGKSTLLNAIVGEKRAAVHERPGTTRDVIDIGISNRYGDFLLLDTAGIRRKPKVESRVETYSIIKSRRAVEASYVALLVIDGVEGFTHQDKRVSEIIVSAGVGCLIIVNKRDKMEREFTKREVHWQIPYLSYAPLVYISALYDRDFSVVFKMVKKISDERRKRVGTGELNRFFQRVLSYRTPPLSGSKEVKLKYMVQAYRESGGVPRFIIFTNYPKDVHESYKRYLIRRLREEFHFFGNPIELIFKKG